MSGNKPDTLICTVGTSVLRPEEHQTPPSAQALLQRLRQVEPDNRAAGAEANSIFTLLQKGKLSARKALYLCTSATASGELVGQALRSYFRDIFHFERIEVHTIDDLTDEDAAVFRRGLRNLVRTVAMIIRDARAKGGEVAINATGGYKAQISFAALLGQVFVCPVYYRFERFSECIELPPMPISFDYSLWLSHADLLDRLRQENTVETKSLKEESDWHWDDPRLAPLLDHDEEHGLLALSPMGELFHAGFEQQFFVRKIGRPPDSGIEPDEKEIKYEGGNAGKHKGLSSHLERIARRPYVTRIATTYYNPCLSRPNWYRKAPRGEFDAVEGWYSAAGAMSKFIVYTTADNAEQQRWIIEDLKEHCS